MDARTVMDARTSHPNMLWYRKAAPAAAHALTLRLSNMGGGLVP
jgi:hypothetical protein